MKTLLEEPVLRGVDLGCPLVRATPCRRQPTDLISATIRSTRG